jgi:hypothetical protein
MLGWIGGNSLNSGTDVLNEYLYTQDNYLFYHHNLRFFKATINNSDTINDCSSYLVKLALVNI